MTTYIIRRLLLMIPTLIGITFLVFMLIALSPGGVGQADRSGGEGQESSAAEAQRQAYLEDKYGLGDPTLVQYGRWLRRASPINFGQQALIDPAGTVIYPPKELGPPPMVGDWYAQDAQMPEQTVGDADDADIPDEPTREQALERIEVERVLAQARRAKAGRDAADDEPLPELTPDEREAALDRAVSDYRHTAAVEAKQSAFRRAQNAYASARADFVQARIGFEKAAAEYARMKRQELRDAAAEARREASERRRAARGEVDAATQELLDEADRLERLSERWRQSLTAEEEPIWSRINELGVDFDSPQGQRILEAGERAWAEFLQAVESRERLADAFQTKPFATVGVGVPDTVTFAAPDLGFSYARSRPVLDLILDALPVTLLLNVIAVPIIYFIAVPAGMLAAVKRGSFFDVASGTLFVALWSIPVVWAGVLLLGFLASDEYLGAFPTGGLSSADAAEYPFLPMRTAEGWTAGWLFDRLWHICLPVVCLVYAGFAVLSKQTRAAMLDNFNADYVRTAKAKGVKNTDVVFRHVFRNSLLPLITMFASIFPAMLAGSVVVEQIFSIPGMGSLMIEAIQLRDRELLLANTLMVGVVNLLALLLADILYALADPRISYE
jgi:peptide/nickel transport system permease protein